MTMGDFGRFMENDRARKAAELLRLMQGAPPQERMRLERELEALKAGTPAAPPRPPGEFTPEQKFELGIGPGVTPFQRGAGVSFGEALANLVDTMDFKKGARLGSGLAWAGAQAVLPGEQEIQRRTNEAQARGLSLPSAALEAWRASDHPSGRVNVLPVISPLIGIADVLRGGEGVQMPVGVKGASELVTDPINLLFAAKPAVVGLKKLGEAAAPALRRGAEAAVTKGPLRPSVVKAAGTRASKEELIAAQKRELEAGLVHPDREALVRKRIADLEAEVSGAPPSAASEAAGVPQGVFGATGKAAAEAQTAKWGAVPPAGAQPPIEPPKPLLDVIPPAEPFSNRPRTLQDMIREAKGMGAHPPEHRAEIMGMTKPVSSDGVVYRHKPFSEHAGTLLGPDTGFMKALRRVPGLKQVFGAWNPAQMSRDNPIAMIRFRQSNFQEVEKSRIRFATLRWWHDADDAFGFKRTGTAYGLKPTEGVWKATKVAAANPSAPKGKMFGTINDIIEHPERYILTPEQARVLDMADATLTQSVRDAQLAGVNVVELADAYWPRVVIKGPKGEKDLGGVLKLFQGRVPAAKGYTHQRVFSDVDDLVKAGFEVETDPRRVFASRLEAGVDTIAQQNSRKQIAAIPGVEKPTERLTRRFPEVLEAAKKAKAARDLAKAAVRSAGAKASPEEVLAMRQAEADYITSMREVFAKKVEVGTPGYYELRLPNGRIAPRELVEEVGKYIDLPELRQPGVGRAAKTIQEISQLLRTTLTNVDLAAGFIQGQSLFYRNHIAWWKAQLHAVIALIDDPTALIAKEFDLFDEGVRVGAIVAPTEFLFAKQGLASLPLRIPYAGPALGAFNRAFEWFITAGQFYLYKAARSGAFKNAGMEDLASLGSAIRKQVGTESYAILGVRPNQRTMEALGFFAARFFRANIGIIGQAFTRGPGGAEARKVMGSMIAGGTAITIGISWAQNKKMPNVTDPYKPDWMMVRLGRTYYNAFGSLYPYFRTLARIGVATAEGNPLKAANELKRFMQSKESIPFRGIDIAGQLAYYGKANVYGTEIENTPSSIAKGVMSEFVTPISLQEVPAGVSEGRPEASLETFGLIGRPVRAASEWKQSLEEYNALPSDPREAEEKGVQTKEEHRKDNPTVDAKSFILGWTTALKHKDTKDLVLEFMREFNLKTEDIKAFEEKEYERPGDERVKLRQWFQEQLGEPITGVKGRPVERRVQDFGKWDFDRQVEKMRSEGHHP